MRSVLRVVIAIACASLVWLAFARDARAAAPQCDERGATTFAKNPVLEVSRASIDIGDDCNLPIPQVDDRAYEEGRGSMPDLSGSGPQTTMPGSIAVLPPTPITMAIAPAETTHVPSGVSTSLERPPRA